MQTLEFLGAPSVPVFCASCLMQNVDFVYTTEVGVVVQDEGAGQDSGENGEYHCCSADCVCVCGCMCVCLLCMATLINQSGLVMVVGDTQGEGH